MGGRVWTIINLAVLVGICLAESTDTSLSASEVPTSTPLATSTVVLTTSTLLSTSTLPPTSTTTTSKSTTTTTTTDAPKTTPVPTTTAVPKPDVKEGTWNVTDGNVTCILADLKIEFTVDIGDQNYDIALSPDADSSSSTCHASNETQVLELSYQNYVLTFEFAKDSDSAYVKNVTFDFSTSGGTERFYNDTKLFPVKYGNSYMCRSTETVSMGNTTMHIYSIQIQAYGGEGGTGFSTAEECEADDNISDIVPIAVACALAALIVVVLIAYLVGRRTNRQKGYTSV